MRDRPELAPTAPFRGRARRAARCRPSASFSRTKGRRHCPPRSYVGTRVVLEHHADISFVGRQAVDRFAVKRDHALAGPLKPASASSTPSPEPITVPLSLSRRQDLSDPISRELAAPFAAWLTDRHNDGSVLCSVCAGAFVLAETGLLAGRLATTHWTHLDELPQRFPDIRVDGDKLIIENGDMITAGGVMAWTDLGMKLVDRLLGSTIMLETARFLLVDPPGREQRYYSSFSPNFHHGDRPILNVQHWLQSNSARDANLHAMAARAGLEERTFLRRFQKATGLRPTEYCQQLRVGRAREMLEFTNQPVDQIAFSIGYEDAGAFRRVFHKVMGISPSAYRKRFGLTTTEFHEKS